MKNINVRKVVAGVAALGISAMFAGAVVAANVTDATWIAPNALTKADLFTNGVPAYNIVLGSMAMPVDVVWAGNIAAAIGKKAYTTTSAGGSATLGDVVVEVGTSGATTISGDGKLFNDWVLGTASEETLDDSDYTLLKDYDVKVDDSLFTDDSENVKDKIGLTATIAFDSDKDVADLTATILKKNIDYNIEFTPAIKLGADDSGSPDMKFNLMGKQYTVEDWDGAVLKLVQNKATTPYSVGDTFELEGYTIEVLTILEASSAGSTFEVEMSISEDGVVKATEVYADGETIFDEFLTIDTSIDTVYNTRITVVSGTSARMTIENGKVIKDFPNTGDKIWFADLTEDGSNGLSKINIYNNDVDIQWKDEDALRVGDKITLPNDFAEIEFLGLTEESSKVVTVENNVLSYTDITDDDHDLFVYEEDTGTYNSGDTYTTTSEIDGKNLYFTFTTAVEAAVGTWDTWANGADSPYGVINTGTQQDGYFTVQLDDTDGKYLTADAANPTTWTWATEAVAGTPDILQKIVYNSDEFTSLMIPLYNNEARKIAYGVYVSESSNLVIDQIGIGLAEGAVGTMETGQTWTVGDIYIGIDSATTKTGTFVGSTTAVTDATIASTDMKSMFELKVTDGTDTAVAHIDAYTGDLVDTSDNDYFTGLPNQVEIDTGTDYALNQDNSDDLTWGYTEFGSKIEVDGGLFTATVPEKQLYGQIFIGGGTSSSTTLNGGEVTLTTVGETVTTEDDAISVKLVSGDVVGGNTGTAITPAVWNVGTNRLVYLDNESPAGAMIIVGGFVVNTLAQTTYGLEDKLVQSGNYVVGKAANGNIVVAGTDAVDTASAAKELIAAIENM